MYRSAVEQSALIQHRDAHVSHRWKHSRSEAAVKGDRREPRQGGLPPLTPARAEGTPVDAFSRLGVSRAYETRPRFRAHSFAEDW